MRPQEAGGYNQDRVQGEIMFDDYMEIMQGGLRAQLERQSNEEICNRLHNLISCFNVDSSLASCYINRLLANEQGFDERTAVWCRYLIDKFLKTQPFNVQALEVGALFMNEGRVPRLKAEVERTDAPPDVWEQVYDQDENPEEREKSLRALALIFRDYPSCLRAAQRVLEYCKADAKDPRMYLMAFRPPDVVKAEWLACLFRHYVQIGLYDKAAKIWPSLDIAAQSETTINCAAAMYAKQGESSTAVAMYERSLALEPRQTPVRLRLREMKNPFQVDSSLLGKRKVCIYLYTWNKSSVFGDTLDSLAATRLGNAKIKVLINGCTDDSLAVAEAAREKFPKNDFEIIETPVNIGAPAARNWLINHKDTWDADYVAFLDDDVTIQEDWLDHFLTVMESDPEIGVVGAKVVTPDDPAYIQYLFRHVDVATEKMMTMSIEAPIKTSDDGLYDFIRPCRSVMGCQHLFRVDALRECPQFDIRFSPSQVDDIEHDLQLNLKGFKVMYTGLVTCIHHQSSGIGQHASLSLSKMGNALGNDLKMCFKHFANQPKLARLDSLSLLGDAAPSSPEEDLVGVGQSRA